MTITKDEARILAHALDEYKYELYASYPDDKLSKAIEPLIDKLREQGDDKRRYGRTSQDSFYDVLRRYVIKFKELPDAD